VLIGVQPTCDVALAIWPPAFHAYNVIVPGCLNLPELLLGLGTDRRLVSLAMYASSRGAQCRYCSAHTCSFALRRGVTADVLRAVTEEKALVLSPIEQAVVDVSFSLGQVPCTLTKEKTARMRGLLSEHDVEWVVGAIAMFGSFNKLMDGIDVPVETETVDETLHVMRSSFGKVDSQGAPPPPLDSFLTLVRVVLVGLFGGGASVDSRLVKDTPKRQPDASEYLQRATGAGLEPVLNHLRHGKLIRAVAKVFSLNFSSDNSALGIKRKILCAARFASLLHNTPLAAQIDAMAHFHNVDSQMLQNARDEKADDTVDALTLRVVTAISSSPAQMTEQLVSEVRASGCLSSAMLIEIVSAIATLQMMHRIISFYHV
jgi:alkylhydroperoxidase family enzyme